MMRNGKPISSCFGEKQFKFRQACIPVLGSMIRVYRDHERGFIMKKIFMAWMVIALAGCTLSVISQPKVTKDPTDTAQFTPDYEASKNKQVIVQEWVTGFVPEYMARREILSIDGIGNWKVERLPLSLPTLTPSLIATGSIAPSQLQTLVNKAFQKNAITGVTFTELPPRLETYITDVPQRAITLNLKGGAFKVEDPGSGDATFNGYFGAIASATIEIPRPI